MTDLTVLDELNRVGALAAEAVNGAMVFESGAALSMSQMQRIQNELAVAVADAGLPMRPTEVEHLFADGLYCRKYPMPAGQLAVTKIHAKQHFIVICGDATIWTSQGQRRVVGFHCMRTEPGTKRVIFAHADTLFVTFHATTETDPERAEDILTELEGNIVESNL
jgi:hypothetical protein